MKKLQVIERNVVIDSFEPAARRFIVKQLDYSLSNSMRDRRQLRYRKLSRDSIFKLDHVYYR